MKRRRPLQQEGSMELLLDTICNAFGSVVFIALLVVILVSMSSQQSEVKLPDGATAAQFQQMENRHRELVRRVEQLQAALRNNANVTETILSEEAKRIAEKYVATRSDLSRIVSQNSRAVGQAAAAQESINELMSDAARRKSELEAAQRERNALRKRLEITVQQNSREAVIPKIVTTSKPPKTFFLVDGKLYGPQGPMREATQSPYFKVVRRGQMAIVTVRSDAGIEVDPHGKNHDQITSLVADGSMHGFYAKLFVWPDSYEHVEAVRVALDDGGVPCEIIPCEDDTEIVLSGGSSSGPALVQ